MFKQIHRRLAAFSTIVAGMILTCAVGLILMIHVSENRKNETERIKNSWITVLSGLQTGNQFDDIRLAQMEAGNQLIIHIEENGQPLLFAGSWTPPTGRNILLNRVMDAARTEGMNLQFPPVSSYGSQTQAFEIEGDFNDRYYALAAAFPVGKGMRNIYLVSYVRQNNGGPWLYVLAAVYVCGTAGLWGTSRFFIGKALQPAKDAQERQKKFIAAASHELRAPLAVINSSLYLLSDETPEQQQLISHIDTECKRMSRLIGDMLLLYTADSKTWSLKPERIELDSLIIDVYDSFLPLCREKGIHLKLELPDAALTPVEGDSQRLQQVFAILLDNAVTYSPPDSDITIRLYSGAGNASCHSDVTVIEINDQGSGIPDEAKPYIFDRFYCADYAHSDKDHFGLGLSIAKEIVEMHRGQIRVEDHFPQGTSFKISLPK